MLSCSWKFMLSCRFLLLFDYPCLTLAFIKIKRKIGLHSFAMLCNLFAEYFLHNLAVSCFPKLILWA